MSPVILLKVPWYMLIARLTCRFQKAAPQHEKISRLTLQVLEAARQCAIAAACQGSAADICKAVCLEVAATLAGASQSGLARPEVSTGSAPGSFVGRRLPCIVAAVGNELVIEAAAEEAESVQALLAQRLDAGTLCVGGAPVAGLRAHVHTVRNLDPLHVL